MSTPEDKVPYVFDLVGHEHYSANVLQWILGNWLFLMEKYNYFEKPDKIPQGYREEVKYLSLKTARTFLQVVFDVWVK